MARPLDDADGDVGVESPEQRLALVAGGEERVPSPPDRAEAGADRGQRLERIEVTAEVWDRMRMFPAFRTCASTASSSAFAASAKREGHHVVPVDLLP